jgi:MFS family permease
MGFISTGNFIGYLAGVVLAGLVARRAGARRTVVFGLFLVGGSMVMIGAATSFHQVLFLYIATGAGSSIANIPMMGLVPHWFLRSIRGRAAGTMLTGNALAIVFAGIYVPWLGSAVGAGAWRTGWYTMGAIAIAVAVIAGVFLRNTPAEKGLAPLGKEAASSALVSDAGGKGRSRRGALAHLGAIFFFFGATQVVYATFIVTVLVTERGFGEAAAGTFWAVVGACSIFSGQLFGWLSDRIGRKEGMMIVYALFTVSFLLAGADLSNTWLFASIAVFGLCMWSIPTIMYAAVGDYMGPSRAVAAIGHITLVCGVGQVLGPALAGIIAEQTGSFYVVFRLCAVLSMMAAFLSFFLRPPKG